MHSVDALAADAAFRDQPNRAQHAQMGGQRGLRVMKILRQFKRRLLAAVQQVEDVPSSGMREGAKHALIFSENTIFCNHDWAVGAKHKSYSE